MKAVVQAGGKGTRLLPYTLVLPKPMMPVGDLPVIEFLLKWLRRNGITEAIVTTGHLGHLLQILCGDGRQWGLSIEYTREEKPLGTIGALALLRDRLDETFLVVNGDLLTDMDLVEFVAHHRAHGDLVTMGVVERSVNVDFGVIDIAGGTVEHFREKPELKYKVSMGIYCMEPPVLDLIPDGMAFGFDELMHRLLEKRITVRTYEHQGMWMDIGRSDDFQYAQQVFQAKP